MSTQQKTDTVATQVKQAMSSTAAHPLTGVIRQTVVLGLLSFISYEMWVTRDSVRDHNTTHAEHATVHSNEDLAHERQHTHDNEELAKVLSETNRLLDRTLDNIYTRDDARKDHAPMWDFMRSLERQVYKANPSID